MEVSKKERLVLFNQYEILKCLNPDDTDYYRKNQAILEYGSPKDIESLFDFIESTTDEVADEVHDILNMFRILKVSYDAIKSKEEIKENDIKFKGFDLNEETDYYIYTKHIIENLNLYEEFKDYELNSHCNKIAEYRRMLSIFNDIFKDDNSVEFDYILNADDIKKIIRK